MVVVAESGLKDENYNFNRIALRSGARYFQYNNYDSAVNHTYNVLRKVFKNDLEQDYGIQFQLHYSLSQLRKIKEDAKNLDYEDYHDLAFIRNNNSEYFADLVIIDGKFGLRYSKYYNDEEFDNLTFEECDFDLSSNVTLLLGMKQKLDNFVDAEIDYQVDCGIDEIKI